MHRRPKIEACTLCRNGFTLVETMVVVAILAIVVAIAYPSYLDQVRKTRRADATSALMESAQLLERCFTRVNSYSADECPDPEGPTTDGHYVVTVQRTPMSYTLTATPVGDQLADPCGAFTLDHLGNKTPVPDNRRCWGS